MPAAAVQPAAVECYNHIFEYEYISIWHRRRGPAPGAAPVPLPKLVECWREGYSAKLLASDLVAGVTVGLVALPLAMAFAIASGLPPQTGIYCGVVAGFMISALGGSRVQIGGPTGAFVVVVSGIVATYGLDGLFMCTLMAGVILMLLGVTGLGTAVKYIPRPVVIGFTNGIAILIASTQIRDSSACRPRRCRASSSAACACSRLAGTASGAATLLAPATIAVILGCRRVSPPHSRQHHRAAGRLGAAWRSSECRSRRSDRDSAGCRAACRSSVCRRFRPDLVLTLLSPALTVAMLGAIESLLSAVVADRMSGDRHNPNVELTAQGVANVLSPLFGGLPATGAIARTATNIRSGARTPVAGMIHAVTLLLVLLFAAPLAGHIPLAMLAGILMIVAYNMGEWREIPGVVRLGPAEAAVWGITFALTVLADLTVAVEAGMILAALLYIRRVTTTTTVARVTPEYIARGPRPQPAVAAVPDDVAIYRIHGPFLFGSTDKLLDLADEVSSLAARGHPAAAQHDGHRRHRTARARAVRRRAARERPDAAAVRHARPAGAHDGARRHSIATSATTTCCRRWRRHCGGRRLLST